MYRIKEALIEDNNCSWYKLDYKKFYLKNIDNSGMRSGLSNQ